MAISVCMHCRGSAQKLSKRQTCYIGYYRLFKEQVHCSFNALAPSVLSCLLSVLNGEPKTLSTETGVQSSQLFHVRYVSWLNGSAIVIWPWLIGWFLWLICHTNIPPCAGHENNMAQSKRDKWPSSPSRFSPFNCCLSVVLQLDKVDYPENSHFAFCPKEQRSFEPFMWYGWYWAS